MSDCCVDEEHGRMTKHNVWQAIIRKDLCAAAKILAYMWYVSDEEESQQHIPCMVECVWL
jgi:hypothetical protein